ncbi:unknown [Clostridium sp. CAG:306]|nr:unknown [Clostridium sp. CAG:306]
MKIGNAWAKTSDDGQTYISVALDEVILEKYPFLKNCFVNLWRIPQEERKNENSPGWAVNLSAKKEKPKEEQELLD